MQKTVTKSRQKIKKSKPSLNIIQVFIGLIFPKSRKIRLIIDLAVCVPLIIIAGFYYSSYKVELMKQKPGYTEKQDMGMFWSETAFHYRYAKMFADKDPNVWNTLANDRYLQYPDGVNAWKDYTTFMEPVCGWFYRLFVPASVPFHIFIMWFVALFGSLTAFIIYSAVRISSGSPIAGMISSLIWMLLPAAYMRQVSNIYLKEDFSMIFIILFYTLFLIGLKNKKISFPIIGAIALMIALLSWHFSQFMFLMFMGCIFLLYVFEKDWQTHYTRNLVIYTVAAAFASLAPVLWERTTIISQPMIFAYSLIAVIFFRNRLPEKFSKSTMYRFALPMVIIVFLSVLNFLFNKQLAEYSHVFQLLIYKIINLDVVPKDPSTIPYNVRVFWAGGFEGMGIAEYFKMFHSATFGFIISLIIFIGIFLKRRQTSQELFLFLILVASFISTILVGRLMIFPAVFTCIGFSALFLKKEAVLALIPLLKSKKEDSKSINMAAAYLPILILVVFLIVNYSYLKSIQLEIPENVQDSQLLYSWIKANTAPGDALLASISDSPTLLLYTGRPVVLNSQFENTFIRKRSEEFSYKYFSSPDTLWDFCHKLGVKYLVINNKLALLTSPGTPRYSVCLTKLIPFNSAAEIFQFKPKETKGFYPLYDNNSYRVIKVMDNFEKPAETYYWERGCSAFFNPIMFITDNSGYIETDETYKKINDVVKISNDAVQYFDQIIEIQKRNQGKQLNTSEQSKVANILNEANKKLSEAAAICPYDATIFRNWAILDLQAGLIDKATPLLLQALKIAPTDREIISIITDIYTKSNKWNELSKVLEDSVIVGNICPDLIFLRSWTAYQIHDYAKSFQISNEIIIRAKSIENYNYDISDLYFVRGSAEMNLGLSDQAKKDFNFYIQNGKNSNFKKKAQEFIAN
jgi:hypothetical protein